MSSLLRTRCSPVILIALLLSLTLAWAPGTPAQEAPPAIPCAEPEDGVRLADETFPAGVVREEVLGRSPTLDNAGAETVSVVAASIVCFDPATLVEIEMLTPGMFTTEIPHGSTTTFTVTEGELQVNLVHLCVPAGAGGSCATESESTASYFVHDDLSAKQSFPAAGSTPAADDSGWVTLTGGDIVVLSEVTVQYQTPADQQARILVSGVYRAVDGGGCLRSCWTP